jgi:hypothetical protein
MRDRAPLDARGSTRINLRLTELPSDHGSRKGSPDFRCR